MLWIMAFMFSAVNIDDSRQVWIPMRSEQDCHEAVDFTAYIPERVAVSDDGYLWKLTGVTCGVLETHPAK